MGEERARSFADEATPREISWINRLRSWKPVGYNTIYAVRRRKTCRHARNNPMRRHQAVRDNTQDGVLHRRVFACRDLDRRVRYLYMAWREDTLDQIDFQRYQRYTLRKLIYYLQARIDQKLHEVSGMQCRREGMTTVLAKLRYVYFHLKPPVKRTPKVKNPLLFRIKWHSSAFDRVQLSRILRQTEGWPLPPVYKERLVVSRVLCRSIGDVICNYTKKSQGL